MYDSYGVSKVQGRWRRLGRGKKGPEMAGFIARNVGVGTDASIDTRSALGMAWTRVPVAIGTAVASDMGK